MVSIPNLLTSIHCKSSPGNAIRSFSKPTSPLAIIGYAPIPTPDRPALRVASIQPFCDTQNAPNVDPTTNQTTSTRPLSESSLVPLQNTGAPGRPVPGGADVNINLAMSFDPSTFDLKINGVKIPASQCTRPAADHQWGTICSRFVAFRFGVYITCEQGD